MIPPGCFGAREAGKQVGKSAHWMYEKGAAGLIPRSKLGHHVWWTPEQIAEIKASAEQPAKPQQAPEPPAEQPKPQQAKRSTRKKRTTKTKAKPANGVPTADFTVSRLYREEATQ